MDVREIDRFLEQWQMGAMDLRRRIILAPTPWGARWYAASCCWPKTGGHRPPGGAAKRYDTIGRSPADFDEGRPAAMIFEQTGGSTALGRTQQRKLKGVMRQAPATSGMALANWRWKRVRQFVSERFSVSLSRSSYLNYLHRLGFAFKRAKKLLAKADDKKGDGFVAEYAALREESGRAGARILFADEAHFRTGADLGENGY